MLYIKYSELTERYYLVPKSKKESKVDITDDIKEIVEFEKSKSPSPSEAGEGLIDGEQRCCNQCGGKLSEVRGRYPKQPKRIICPTCAIEELESMKQNNLTAKNNKDE